MKAGLDNALQAVGAAQGVREQSEGNGLHSPAATVEAQIKRLVTLKARAALAGIVVIDSRDDTGRPDWIAASGPYCKAFASVDDLEQWLNRVTGSQK